MWKVYSEVLWIDRKREGGGFDGDDEGMAGGISQQKDGDKGITGQDGSPRGGRKADRERRDPGLSEGVRASAGSCELRLQDGSAASGNVSEENRKASGRVSGGGALDRRDPGQPDAADLYSPVCGGIKLAAGCVWCWRKEYCG